MVERYTVWGYNTSSPGHTRHPTNRLQAEVTESAHRKMTCELINPGIGQKAWKMHWFLQIFLKSVNFADKLFENIHFLASNLVRYTCMLPRAVRLTWQGWWWGDSPVVPRPGKGEPIRHPVWRSFPGPWQGVVKHQKLIVFSSNLSEWWSLANQCSSSGFSASSPHWFTAPAKPRGG